MNKSETVWQCENCGTVYAEYVNGCPHCETVGVRSKVVGRNEELKLGAVDE
jgi:predicted ATP-dependent serine protease